MTIYQFNLRPKSLIILGLIALFVYGLGEARTPLFVSAVLSYLTFPVVRWIERRWGTGRGIATFLVLLGLILPFIVLMIFVIPLLIEESVKLTYALPGEIISVLTRIEGYAQGIGVKVPFHQQDLSSLITSHIQNFATDVLSSGVGMLRASVLSVSALVLALLNFVLIPVFFVYITKDYEKWVARLCGAIPDAYQNRYRRFVERTSFILNGYVRGQLLACLVMAALYGGGLQLVGLNSGWLIGMLTGFFCFIPYLGFSLGLATALIVALTQADGGHVFLATLIVLGVIQALENSVIIPRLVGNRVGLTPMEAILTLIVAGNLFGFIGILFAIPMGAFLKELLLIFFMAEAAPTSILIPPEVTP